MAKYDPNAYKQTHDPMGRTFTEPQSGGPVPGKMNLTFGEIQADGSTMISYQRDEKTTDLIVHKGYEDGFPITIDEDVLRAKIAPIIANMDEYEADIPYWSWYETYVGDQTMEQMEAAIQEAFSEFEIEEIG
jgi:hypothetical protein